jgi:DNA-binding response OmpR family regulator
LVDDDPAIGRLIRKFLEREGYEFALAETVAAMRDLVDRGVVDLVLLDFELPDEDGWSALRWLRARGSLPVLMLTGRGDTVDKVIGLELGADDYLAKPFDLRELLARIRNVQRRLEKPAAPAAAVKSVVAFDGWTLDLSNQQLKSETGERVHLTQAEYNILTLFARNSQRVISREELLEISGGRSWDPGDRSIDVHISNLRRKLDGDSDQPSRIRTIRNGGYMFMPSCGE